MKKIKIQEISNILEDSLKNINDLLFDVNSYLEDNSYSYSHEDLINLLPPNPIDFDDDQVQQLFETSPDIIIDGIESNTRQNIYPAILCLSKTELKEYLAMLDSELAMLDSELDFIIKNHEYYIKKIKLLRIYSQEYEAIISNIKERLDS